MAIGAIYQLTHTARLFGKSVENVYFYRGETADSSAQDLAAAFQEDITPAIAGIQTPEVQNDRLSIITLFDFTDFFDADIAVTRGGVASDALPRSVAMNYTLRTNVRNIGPGSKRFAGISGSYQNDNTWTGGILAAAETLRIALAATIGAVIEDTYKPVIVKRVFYEATETAKEGYYMPREVGDLLWAYVTSAALALDVSHQTSRD